MQSTLKKLANRCRRFSAALERLASEEGCGHTCNDREGKLASYVMADNALSQVDALSTSLRDYQKECMRRLDALERQVQKMSEERFLATKNARKQQRAKL